MSDTTVNTNQYMASGVGDLRTQIVTTSGSVTITNQDLGKTFYASTTATFTLPAPSAANAGARVKFTNLADTDMTVTSTNTVVALNNATADGVAFSTTSEKIGGSVEMESNGSKWIANNLSDNTMTVVSA
jgi:hypothetical protein